MEESVPTAPEFETAILVAVDTGEYDIDSSLDELEELARTAGAEVKGRLIQKRESPNAATCIGAGPPGRAGRTGGQHGLRSRHF